MQIGSSLNKVRIPMLILPEQLVISTVQEFKEDMLAYIAEHDLIEIDDTHVSRIDTIGAQLLLAMVTFIASQKKDIQWQSSSNVIKANIKSLGIDEPILNQFL